MYIYGHFYKVGSFQENFTKNTSNAVRYLLKEMVVEDECKAENILLRVSKSNPIFYSDKQGE